MDSSISIPEQEKKAANYLNRSTILFGSTGSGKSTIILEILYILKDVVPIIIVVAPTAELNNDYKGILPECMINLELDMDKLVKLFKRQEYSTRMYNKVHDLKALRRVAHRINPKIRSCVEVFHKKTAREIYIVNESKLSANEKRCKIKNIKKNADSQIDEFYSNLILSHREQLKKDPGLSENDKFIVQYVDFNPLCVLILDDCGDQIKELQKHPVINKILTKGRHYNICLILSLQDDTHVSPVLKKNAFNLFFSTKEMALSYFGKASNQVSNDRAAKKRLSTIIEKVYESSGEKTFRNLVYTREDQANKFKHSISDIHEDFKVCCQPLWDFDNKLTVDSEKKDIADDPDFRAFKIDW